MGVRGILKEWVNFRMDCIKRQTLYDIDKKTKNFIFFLAWRRFYWTLTKPLNYKEH